MAEGARLALVTGASGFVGSHVVEALVEGGFRVRCLVRRTSNLRWLPADRVELAFGDVADAASLPAAIEGCSVVYHLAGLTSAPSDAHYRRVNVEGTRHVVAAMRAGAPDAALVFCSSLAVGGPARDGRPVSEGDPPNPIGAYGRSKLEAERVVEGAPLRQVILRPPPVYGPRDVDILEVFRLAARGLALRVGSADQRLSMIHVRDLAHAFVLTADRGRGVYYVTDGAVHTWNDLIGAVASAVGRRVRRIPIPGPVAAAVGAAGRAVARLTGAKPLLTPDRVREFRQPAWICDDERARRELGYVSRIPLTEGMRDTARWYLAQGWI